MILWQYWRADCPGIKSKRRWQRNSSVRLAPARSLKAVTCSAPRLALVGAGRSNAGRPKLPIRLMASPLYLKHSFNLSDEELVVRWSENIVWQG